MKFLDKLFRLDLAKLYYSDGLILIVVVVSLMITVIPFLGFLYLMFFKDISKMKNKDYESHRKFTFLTGSISLVGVLSIFLIFRFAHFFNQTVTAYFINLVS